MIRLSLSNPKKFGKQVVAPHRVFTTLSLKFSMGNVIEKKKLEVGSLQYF